MTAQFIVFEGPDGSGTTRQCAFLAERLRKKGVNVLLTAEPTESSIGQEIRSMLSSPTLPSPDAIQLLFTADRANHVDTVIRPALEAGQVVICDRYALSTIIYGTAQGVDKQWLELINAPFPKPSMTFVTLPPFDVCKERLERRKTRDQFEMESFQRRVYEYYQSYEDANTIFVDTSGSKKESADFVYKRYEEHFSKDKAPVFRAP